MVVCVCVCTWLCVVWVLGGWLNMVKRPTFVFLSLNDVGMLSGCMWVPRNLGDGALDRGCNSKEYGKKSRVS